MIDKLNDLEIQQQFLIIFPRLQVAKHLSAVNCIEITRDRP